MLSRRKRIAIFAASAASLVFGIGATAASAGTADPGDNFSLPAGTAVNASLAPGTTLTLAGTIDGFPITVKCTTFTASGTIPASGLIIILPAPPTISGCTDSLGGHDTLTTNQTNGPWAIAEVDTASATADTTEPNSGDRGVLSIPKAGATFKAPILPTCTVTSAPAGRANVIGTYNDVNTTQDTNAAIPTSGSGCTTGPSSKATATVVFDQNVHDTT